MAPSNHNKEPKPGLLRVPHPTTKLSANALAPAMVMIIKISKANWPAFKVACCFYITAFDMRSSPSWHFNWHVMANLSYTGYGTLGWLLPANLIMIYFLAHANFLTTVDTPSTSNTLKVIKTMESSLSSHAQPHSILKQIYLPKVNWLATLKAQPCTIYHLHMAHVLCESTMCCQKHSINFVQSY